ncbi:MAG: DNA repair and recombination protein RadB [DPANN group archaeon]|nr:DNA repair and recombination protein RadB [DPANN group archaeon]
MEKTIKETQKLPLRAKGITLFFNGGIESGVVTNIYGVAGSAKTSFSLEAAVSCIQNGKKVIFMDTEGGFSVERFMQMTDKKNLENILLFRPKDFKEQTTQIESFNLLCDKQDIGLIIIDSLVSLYRLKKNNKDFSETNQELSRQLAKLSEISRDKNIPILVTNQVYTDFDTGELELVGRDIPKYASKCLVYLEKIGTGKRKMTMTKHRSIAEGVTCSFEIKNEGLVDIEKRFKIF